MYSIEDIKTVLKPLLTDKDSKLVNKKAIISNLLIDSRKLNQSKKSLFFAINGKRLDGHQYIAELYKKGIRNFIVEKSGYQEKFPKANFIQVKNTIDSLQKIACFHRENFNILSIGITGSNGKTIVKEWLHQLLHQDFNIVRSPKSYNSQIGVPLSVWNIKTKHNLAIFEAGISEPNEMENLERVIQPMIGIFTNIGSAHGQNFISDLHKAKEKLKLFVKAKLIIYCKDHTVINQSIADFWSNTLNDEIEKPIFFNWSEKVTADLRILKKTLESKTTVIECLFKGKTVHFTIPFIDSSSIENAIHCIAFMLYKGYETNIINSRLKRLKRIEMRLEQKKGINNCIVINDSYNSDIDSLKIALEFLAQQEQTEKRTVILSDILQSGITGVDLYSSVAEMMKQAKVSTFIGIGKEIFHHKYLFNNNENLNISKFYASTNEFIKEEQEENFNNEAILLKGARSFYFERINTFLEEKTHATVFEINLESIIHNLNYFTSILKPKTKVMAMVKAFAYGSGSYEIAKLLEHHKIDYLAVAYADEGIALRKVGIQLPIMVLNPEQRSFDAMIRYRLEPEIYSLDMLKSFAEAINLATLNEVFPIHLKIDTGMKRLGFEEEELEWLALILSSNKQLKVASIFSHLAASEDKKWDKFTKTQINKFEKAYDKICSIIEYKPIKHIVNSNGAIRFKNAQFDMIRLGLGLYGINENVQKELIPVGTLTSTISQIRNIKKGETIGYGRVGKMKKDGKIAIVAIGYADGLSRALSNGKGFMFLKNKKVPIIGNVCMDMTMIDVSDIDNVAKGDKVEIFGENINVNDLAKQAHTISYEILTSISERVKRVFFVE